MKIHEVKTDTDLYNRCIGKVIKDIGWNKDDNVTMIGIVFTDGTELELSGIDLTIFATEKS